MTFFFFTTFLISYDSYLTCFITAGATGFAPVVYVEGFLRPPICDAVAIGFRIPKLEGPFSIEDSVC